MTDKNDPEADARHRFMSLQIIRLLAILMVGAGLYIALTEVIQPVWIGYLLIAIGLFEFLILPQFLIKAWKRDE